MGRQPRSLPDRELPEAGVGGEGPAFDQTVLAPTTDAEVAQAVHDALLLDPDVAAGNFEIDVESGIVRLSGRPRSPEERQRAVELASRVQGVRRVVARFDV